MATYFEWAEGYNSYAGTDVVVTAQLAYLGNDTLKNKCYILGSLQTISISTYQDKKPVRAIGNINAIDYVMGQRTIAGSLVFAVFDRHFADEIFNDLKQYTGKSVLLTDEIPPLDLTIIFANEYGKKSKMVLYGVRMISEGQVMSINDLYTENTYQFIALGMEPLTAEDTEYEPLSTDKTNSNTSGDKNSNSNSKNSTQKTNSANSIKNNTNNNSIDDTSSKEGQIKYKYFKINQPISNSGNAIINFDIYNKAGTNIYIVDKNSGKETVYNDAMLETNNWHVELPQGEYTIKYINSLENEYSELSNLSIKYDKNENEEKKDYTIINYITNDSLYLDSNNSNHNKLIIEKCDDNSINEIPITKNKIFVTDLESNTLYKFYTSNNINNSKINYAKTLLVENEDLLMLIEYVKNNKNLWVNDFSKFDFNKLNNNGLTLLDRVINLEDDNYKQELLLYTIKLQNDLINVYNNLNDISKLTNTDLLNIKLRSDNEINKINIYNATNNNEYFKYTIYNLNNNTFIGNPNKRYIYQPITNNIKGIKYNYCFLEKNEKEKLEVYSKKYYLENQDLTKYKSQYINYDDELLKAILIKDKNYPDKYILEGPAFTYNDLLVVDINYQDSIQKNKNYYLCISSIYDALNYTPIRKIEFSSVDKELVLENYKTGLINNNYYVMWIEDENFKKISLSTIISTYSDTLYLEDYKSIYVNNFLNELTKILLSSLSCKDLLNSIYFSIRSYNPFPKNIIYLFEQELINQGYYSLYSNNLDFILFTLLKTTKQNTKKLCDKIKISNDKVTFINPNNCKVVIINYYLDNDFPTISDSDLFEINLNNNSLYTVLYLKDNNMIDSSGFILINNLNSKYYNYEIEIEVE